MGPLMILPFHRFERLLCNLCAMPIVYKYKCISKHTLYYTWAAEYVLCQKDFHLLISSKYIDGALTCCIQMLFNFM